MWFSPWRRILRGRSGDAKPSGLRAGTKFVEEDTGVEYTYDPVMKDRKKRVEPYSAIVCKDGSTVWAEDSDGKTIASGESGVDDASVIQKAEDNANGYVYILEGEYIINYPILIKQYTFGAGIDRTVLKLGDGVQKNVVEIDDYSGLMDVTIDGNYLNNLQNEDTWANVNDVPMAHGIAVFKYYHTEEVFVRVSHVRISNVKVINTVRSNIAINADECSIDNIVLQNSYTDHNLYLSNANKNIVKNLFISGMADAECIVIGTDDNTTANYNSIENVYIKDLQSGKWQYPKIPIAFRPLAGTNNTVKEVWIFDDSTNNVRIYIAQQNAKLKGVHAILSGSGKDCAILIGGLQSGQYAENIIVTDIHIYVDTTDFTEAFHGIKMQGGKKIIITDYEIHETGGTVSRAFAIDSYNEAIQNVLINNVIADIYGSCIFRIKQDTNSIEGLKIGKYINVNNITKFLIDGSPTFYENSDVATFSGDGSTTDFEIGAHGLVITDPSKIAVKVTPASSDAIAASPCVGYVDPADNTKIRVKFSSAPASGDNNVQIVWRAEVIS